MSHMYTIKKKSNKKINLILLFIYHWYILHVLAEQFLLLIFCMYILYVTEKYRLFHCP